ncbi:NADH dehydrogenase [ubiquinone] flavoprotein 2 mitochondrial [Phtheirospermum japonicum]|uniref:NADH dehydrogenase [ubiquinone] flavoprotein 2 mitochondrial n=1 Tax=Phtheirospermum japonicum TaxID=374723 RepID=A0A830BAB6_9LAMI|nr:NADH dehydrogenase [ubiquinone] flavoprotein 2 mitochondrial [Phtheirospermum japonicum]
MLGRFASQRYLEIRQALLQLSQIPPLGMWHYNFYDTGVSRIEESLLNHLGKKRSEDTKDGLFFSVTIVRATVVALYAEVRRTKVVLIDEVPKLQKLAQEKGNRGMNRFGCSSPESGVPLPGEQTAAPLDGEQTAAPLDGERAGVRWGSAPETPTGLGFIYVDPFGVG